MTTPRSRAQAIPARVLEVRDLTERLRRVRVVAPDLFEQGREWLPGQWVRAYVPDLAADGAPGLGAVRQLAQPQHRPAMSASAGVEGRVARAYTILNWDPASEEFDLDFVRHGRGPAAGWVATASEGDELPVAGPMGRKRLDPTATRLLYVADATALPAVSQLVPRAQGRPVRVLAEVAGPGERPYATELAGAEVTWVHAAGPTRLAEALIASGIEDGWLADPGLRVWAAGEAGQVSEIRRHALGHWGLARTALHAAGYWRAGAAGDDSDLG